MLRIIIFIQCDICNDFLTEIAPVADPREASADNRDRSLLLRMHDLRLVAEEHGWQSTNDSTVHHCPTCCRQ